MKKNLIILFLVFAPNKLLCQNKPNEYKSIFKKIKLYDEIKQKDSVLKFLDEYLALSKKNNDSLYIGKAYQRKGIYYKKYKKKDSSYYFYKKSIPYFLKLKDSLRVSKSLINISFILSSFENFSDSDSAAVEALRYLSKNENKYKGMVYNSLAINSKQRLNYGDAIKYYKKAIELPNNKSNLIKFYSNLANSYGYNGDYKKALTIYQNLLDTTDFSDLRNTKSKVIDNLARIKWENKIDENVLKDFIKARDLRKKEDDYVGLISSYKNLSNYYFKVDKFKSYKNAEKMYYYAVKEKSIRSRVEALNKLVLYPSSKQSVYFEELKELKDSIKLSEGKKKIKFAKIKYDAEEEKRKKLEAKARLAESNFSLEQQRSQKQLWLFAAILTIVTSIVYFFYKREKTKKEKAIEVYNTETRLSKKIHDELANDVYAVMNTLQNKAETDTKLLARVEKIYAQTRDISHENSPVLTGEHFESFLKQLFIDFTNDTCKVIHKGLKEVVVNELPKEKQIVLYRVLRELLVNMKKHSEASLVLITFSLSKKMLSVVYQDNGEGVKSLSIKNGLQNMETRIKSVGGIITFESKQEKGFQAKFQFKK
ncbi:tetratricopeptide repeat-containing sensor histidine kinase [Tenacibaculum caenipelagi]|uniref:histidine kinase n=1 Tax=Tenacibaculum caenipelagi TaxID=1325435 RepID=A0A4R6TGP3_9FLAO|nr:tetratricopeptide repeat-containing sensor histidine kinase [Tenacibaculum caenipelagi]TDQ29733.1 hypothetical protein DFQ07_0053 [Tenacibaculum caenipelagi]